MGKGALGKLVEKYFLVIIQIVILSLIYIMVMMLKQQNLKKIKNGGLSAKERLTITNVGLHQNMKH